MLGLLYALLLLGSYINCEECLSESRFNELESVFILRFEKLENQNIALKEKLQKLESKLEQYEERGKEKLEEALIEKITKNPGSSNIDFVKLDGEDIAVDTMNNFETDADEKRGVLSDTNNIVPGTVGLKRQVSENVAFHAYISGNRCYGVHETFVFDVEVSDYGNGYNILDGIFDAPLTGVYVFTLTVLPTLHTWIKAEIVINGLVVGKTVADSDHSEDYHPGSATVVVHVNAGDHVSVRRGSGADCDVVGNGYARTTFSGWLLF